MEEGGGIGALAEPILRYEGEGWRGEVQEPLRRCGSEIFVEGGKGLHKLVQGGGQAEVGLHQVTPLYKIKFDSRHKQYKNILRFLIIIWQQDKRF